ncbi:cytochrome C [Halobacillus halophilus]|uniref:Cytochrome c-550 n=1 Tax=Halobacillus halophilus (strain ATCC 35676 / DSM 2266 / JCM 20832 / KCTC 3685 / LMG 17431 / NBRC 102448 / NCIMB 2269) TaxID=866895 RepID=I0JP22_HALH3|nr:cytochrome c [Halobacillus halophilus]ASF39934.1 cytochrome C [Halobacillus halophilus]CCG45892.1 cytochrome c-550 [Halobacillus halophilus DSM 2266]
MRRNPVIPFAIIAVLGIVAMIIVSAAGINQREAIQNEEENGGEQQQEETTNANPEEMFQSQCASCHGGNLEGGTGPNLTEVGSRYSAEEIQDIIVNGKGSAMPAGLYTGEKAAALAKWLAEKK